MLSELFAELIIDSDDCHADNRLNLNCTNLYMYAPLDQSPRWFLDDNLYHNKSDNNTREIVQNRAAFAYLQGDYITAMDIYFHLLENETKTGSCNSIFALIDSIIRCGLKIAPIHGPQLFLLLQKQHALVSTYDEQLQYWAQSLEVHASLPNNDYLRNAILLCANVDLPEFWISISKNAPDLCANLRIGSLCRAVCILEKLLPSKGGCFNSHDLKLMKIKLQNLCNKEKLSEAKAAVCIDLVGSEKAKANRPSLCKNILKDKKAEDVVILEFIHRFYWLFTDVSHQIVSVMLQLS
ncbi:unnamed protein product [Onchocerca flexuosa]|uniref:Nuclear pore complex protein Nup85 n=1 Tax=Onchocerca flexuosa TaxID=387005 RepID=A0A183HCK8_9BILA|nr:unnamed protein product [Onchocerca flexuosa]